MGALRIESEHSGDTLHLRLEGELDLAGVSQLEQELEGRTDSEGTVVVDLRGIEFIDS
jgi:anti-anti-sigma factor